MHLKVKVKFLIQHSRTEFVFVTCFHLQTSLVDILHSAQPASGCCPALCVIKVSARYSHHMSTTLGLQVHCNLEHKPRDTRQLSIQQ
jgi:hypothetical protein